LRPSRLVAALVLTATIVSAPLAGFAQDAVRRPAEIRTGTCSSIGDPVAALDYVVAPVGDEAAPEGVTPVEQSVTVVPILLPDLIAGGYIVVVGKSIDEPGTPVACGVVGGALTEDGTLAVGLNPMDGSRIDGVAYFSPKRGDSGTTVTLLLVNNRAAEATSGPVGMAGQDGTITIGGVSEVTDSVSMVDDGSGPAPVNSSVDAPAPAPAETVENAESADGKGNKSNRNGKGGKGKGGKGNAGNDGVSSASG
jgi:hypothetical protein